MANIKQIKQIYYNHKTKLKKDNTKPKFSNTILNNKPKQNDNPTYTFIKKYKLIHKFK